MDQASHFLAWERLQFAKYFALVEHPSENHLLLAFGPDVLQSASELPARGRFAVLFPGFAHNPLHDPAKRALHRALISERYRGVFINPGPLELAYAGLENVLRFPVSIDTKLIELHRYRDRIDSILHASSDYPQKDWQRSQQIMQITGLRHEVFPPRRRHLSLRALARTRRLSNAARASMGRAVKQYPPLGYVSHHDVIRKYQSYDAFIHVARDVKDPIYIDGKYTATFLEAGLSGAILFWHDTFGLGNDLECVFSLPLDPTAAAEKIMAVRGSLDVAAHSRRTRAEILEAADPARSVKVRADEMLRFLDERNT